MDVVADVLAGAENIYAASKRSRDEAQQDNRANPRQTYPETEAASQAEGADRNEAPREDAESKPEVVQAVPVDIEEHAEGYTLFMDVPGLQKSDVKVNSEAANIKGF